MSDRAAPAKRAHFFSPHLLLLLTPLFWASMLVVGRVVVDTVPPVTLSFWVWVGASLILLATYGRTLWRERAVIRAEWSRLASMALFGVVNMTVLVFMGVVRTTAVNAAVLNSIQPILIVLLSFFLLGERLRPVQWAGLLLSMVGVAAVITAGEPQLLLTLSVNPGDLLVMGAYTSWALYTVLLRRFPSRLEPMPFLATIATIAVAMMAPLYAIELGTMRTTSIGLGHLGAMAYIAVVPNLLAYMCWNFGVNRLGANIAGLYLYLLPAYGAVLAMLFLGEQLMGYHLAGIALIVSGVYLAVYAARSATGEARHEP